MFWIERRAGGKVQALEHTYSLFEEPNEGQHEWNLVEKGWNNLE